MGKFIKIFTVSLAAAALATGCSSSGGTTPEQEVKPVEQEPIGPADINLVTPDGTINEEYMAALNKKFPNYTITHIKQSSQGQSIAELIAAGIPIDIIGRAGTGFYTDAVNMKLAVDLTPFLKEYNIKLTDFEPQLIEYIRSISNGGMYGVPGGSAVNHVLFYNKSLFDKFGVTYPKDGMSWNDAMEVAAKLTRTDSGTNYYGFTGHLSVMTAANQLGLAMVDPKTKKPTINTDERWKNYFNIVYGNSVLNEAYRRDNRPFSGSTARLVEGRTAMVLFNANIALNTKELQENKIDWDMVALPSFKEAPKTGSTMNSTIWGLTNQTRNKRAAMEVLNYLISDENLLPLAKKGYLVPKITEPYIKNFAAEAQPAEKNWKAIVYNHYAPWPTTEPYNSLLTPIQVKYIESFVKGENDLNSALRKAEEEMQKVIDENSR